MHNPGPGAYGNRGGAGTAGPTISSGSASGGVTEGTPYQVFTARPSGGSRLKATVATVLLVRLFLFRHSLNTTRSESSFGGCLQHSCAGTGCQSWLPILAANPGCVPLHFVQSMGNSPLVPARGNSVVGTYCKVASNSLGGTLGI
jgi:hypothetical protein